jgi:hypothetical protein
MGSRREFLTAAAAFAAGTVSVGTADAAQRRRIVTILNGKGRPPSVWGIVGDFYIDDHTHAIWGPKRKSGWGKPTSLIGRAGASGSGVGAPGPAGPRGYSILHGDGPPAASLGEDNDFYIDTSSTQLYGPREGDVWGSPVSLNGTDATPTSGVAVSSGGDPRLTRVTAPYMRGQVAVTRCGHANGIATASQGAFTGRVAYTAGPTATADLRLCFSNWVSVPTVGVSEGTPGESCSVKAALELEQGSGMVSFPIWFNGARTISIVDGGEVWSDPLGVEIPAGATFYVRVLYTPGTSSVYPEANIFSTAADTWTAGDSVDGTGALGSHDTGQGLYRPTAITGTPAARVPQVLILGDERAMGNNNPPSYTSYIDTAFDGNFVTVNLGSDQDGANGFELDHAYRGRFIAGCDYAIEVYGGKDVDFQESLATMLASRIAIWQLCVQRGLAVYADTLPPYTSSNDGWTSSNQTHAWNPSQETSRWQMNQWLRAGAPILSGVAVNPGTAGAIVAGDSDHPLAGVIDDAATIETQVHQYGQGADSGIWKVGSGGTALTNNGWSQNAAGCVLSAPSVPVNQLS